MATRGFVKEYHYKTFLKIEPTILQALCHNLGLTEPNGFLTALESGDKKLIIQHYEEMPKAEKDSLEPVFSKINDFNSDDGMQALVQVFDDLGIPRQDKTNLELAAMLYLKDSFQFEIQHRLLELKSNTGCQEFYAAEPIPLEEISEEQQKLLKNLLSERLQALEKGKQIYVETQDYTDVFTLTIWSEDYTKTVEEFNSKGEIEQVTVRPVIESSILYYPDEGKIRVKARNKDLLEIMKSAFAEVCLKKQDAFEHDAARNIWFLERFKQMEQLVVNASGKLLGAEIAGIRGKVSNSDKEVVELRFFSGTLNQTLQRRGINANQFVIQKIWICFQLLSESGRKKRKTICLSHPHGSNLQNCVPDELIKQQLRDWGVLTSAQNIPAMA